MAFAKRENTGYKWCALWKQSFLSRGRAAYASRKILMKVNFQRICPADARTTCNAEISGADALMGHTRSHPEHEG